MSEFQGIDSYTSAEFCSDGVEAQAMGLSAAGVAEQVYGLCVCARVYVV